MNVPDGLVEWARAAGLDVSHVTEEALRHELARRQTSAWVSQVSSLAPLEIPHERVMEALDAARRDDELGA